MTCPLAFGTPLLDGVPKVPQSPLSVNATGPVVTGVPLALVTVAVIVDVDVPLAVIVDGLAVTVVVGLLVWVIVAVLLAPS